MSDPVFDNSLNEAVRSAIQAIAVGPDRGRDIGALHAEQVMQGILDGAVDPVQAAVFLIALRMKRESLSEFEGLLRALTTTTLTQQVDVDKLVILAEPFDGYVRTVSMTPFIAPVLASCGLPSLIHGVESVGPKYGVTAHKVFARAGIKTTASHQHACDLITSAGWAYMDQSVYNPSLFALAELRDKIVKRSAITTLERLLCPLRARHHTTLALAYVHRAYPSIYAAMARRVGYDSAVLFKGVEGGLAPALNKPLRRYVCKRERDWITPNKEIIELDSNQRAELGAMSMTPNTKLPDDRIDEAVVRTLDVGLQVLQGRPGIARDSLCLAAGHILYSNSTQLSLLEAVEKVKHCLDNGAALAAFNRLT